MSVLRWAALLPVLLGGCTVFAWIRGNDSRMDQVAPPLTSKAWVLPDRGKTPAETAPTWRLLVFFLTH